MDSHADGNYARAHPSPDDERAIRKTLREMDIAAYGAWMTPLGGPPSETDLVDMERYCADATPGPWHWTTDALNGEPYKGRRPRSSILIYALQGSPRLDRFDKQVLTLNWGDIRGKVYMGGPSQADETFIALARTDLPRLIAEVRRLRALVQEAAGLIAWGQRKDGADANRA